MRNCFGTKEFNKSKICTACEDFEACKRSFEHCIVKRDFNKPKRICKFCKQTMGSYDKYCKNCGKSSTNTY